jgi:signal recognition particle subunit SRP19
VLLAEKTLLNAIAAIIQSQCGGKPPPLTKKPVRPEKKAAPKSVNGEKTTSVVNNKNAASQVLKKGRRVSRKVKAEDRIKGSRPPPFSARYPLTSPAREAGLLNADFGNMMGGLQGMGPLGAMMGQMGMGGDDDDDAEAEAEKLKAEEEEKKKKKDPMQQLSRRQKKRVVRIGR